MAGAATHHHRGAMRDAAVQSSGALLVVTRTSSQPAALLSVDGLHIESASGRLIGDASFVLPASGRLGIVGRNGGGKSTLLDVLHAAHAGVPPPSHVAVRGGIAWRRGVSTGMLQQHPRRHDVDGSVAQWLDNAAGSLGALHRRHESLTAAMARGDQDEATLADYGEVVHRLTELEAWDYAEQRERVLQGLGIDAGVLSRPLGAVSGGQATRVALAGLLLSRPDVLLLDEPTTDLDEAGVAYLREWLRSQPAAVLLVSHDRDLLDDVATGILAIDEATHVLAGYGGNYSFYVTQREREFAAQVRAYEEQQSRRSALLASAERISAGAQSFQATSQNDYYRARGKKLARRAVVQLARVERQLSDLEEPRPPRRPQFVVPDVEHSRDGVLLQAHEVSIGHDTAAPLLQGLTLSLHHGDRVAVVGPSGAGKTTLLRVLLGEMPPLSGAVTRPRSLAVGHLAQSVAETSRTARAVDVVRARAAVSEDEAHRIVASVVFSDAGRQPLGRFSAGERRRIELAAIFASRLELLVLDEPGNHLDLPTLEMLEEALDAYRGALLLVTHDRRLLARAGAQRVISLDSSSGGGGVRRPGAP
jgi:ATPase subunit of ABC transporter with duplicated ATPase domains